MSRARAATRAASCALAALLLSSSAGAEPLTRVRLDHPSDELAAELSARGFDVVPRSPGAAIDVIADRAELADLEALALDYVTIERGQPLAAMIGQRSATTAGYPRAADITTSLERTAADHPAIARLVDLTTELGTPTTFQGRHLWALAISDNPGDDEDEPAILVLSGMHAREIINPLVALDVIERLTSGYGHDPTITAIVDAYEIWVAPLWNPDGYEHVFTVDNLWRKNRTAFADGIGVDLNRNYPFGWDSDCRGDTDVESRFYRGPGPVSEAETATMLALTAAERFAKVIEFHSAGREVVWGSPCSTNPFEDFLLGQAITLGAVLGYEPRKPNADGQQHHWQLTRLGTLSLLVETHDEWQPDYADALAEVERVWPGVLWMLERPLSVTGQVSDEASGAPLVATIGVAGVVPANGEAMTSAAEFGRYHALLPNGDHLLEFTAPGYRHETRAVSVSANRTVEVNVALTRLGAPAAGFAGEADEALVTVDEEPPWGCGCDSSGSPPAALALLLLACLGWLGRQSAGQ